MTSLSLIKISNLSTVIRYMGFKKKEKVIQKKCYFSHFDVLWLSRKKTPENLGGLPSSAICLHVFLSKLINILRLNIFHLWWNLQFQKEMQVTHSDSSWRAFGQSSRCSKTTTWKVPTLLFFKFKSENNVGLIIWEYGIFSKTPKRITLLHLKLMNFIAIKSKVYWIPMM